MINRCCSLLSPRQLGHASVAFTLDIYSHVLPHMQDAAAEKVQGEVDAGLLVPIQSGCFHLLSTNAPRMAPNTNWAGAICGKRNARATGPYRPTAIVQAPAGLILNAYAKSHGAFSGRVIVTPSALRDHTRLESDPSSPILAISPR